MNNTEDIDLSKYESYYALESLDNFSIVLETPHGEVEYTDYEVFKTDTHQIIAFTDFFIGRTEYNYVIKIGNNKKVIQWLPYEHLYEFLNPSITVQDDVFALYNSVSMAKQIADNAKTALSYEKRCDTDLYMAIGYKAEDGIKPFVVDLEKFNDTTIKKISTLLNYAGIASLTHLKVSDVGTSFRDYPAVSGMSKTFMGCMKLIIEWASLAEEPFNITDEIVLDAKNYIEVLGIPDDVIDEIKQTQEDMPLYRYLKGVDNPREGFTETDTISPLFLKWIKSQTRYVSLNSLVNNMNNPPPIAESKLSEEKDLFEMTIYSHIYRYTDDEQSLTHTELLDILSKPHFIDFEESPLLAKAILWHRALG